MCSKEIVNDKNKVNFSCPVCDSKNFKILFPDTLGGKNPQMGYNFSKEHTLTYQIVQCKKCTHAYASPRPRNLVQYYKDIRDDVYLANEDQYLCTYQKVIKTLQQFKTSGTLLDIGCSAGFFLSVAKNFYHVEGCELSSWASEIAETRELIIHKCELSKIKTDKLFDIITLWVVIEHFEYPREEIRHIYNLLNKNGMVCLWTGDISAFPARLLSKNWWYIQGQHIQYFTRKSLTKLFINNGFQELHIGLYPYVMTMSSIHKSLARYPLLHLMTKPFLCNKIIKNLKLTLKLPGEMFAVFIKKSN